jgi:hypothetical protein
MCILLACSSLPIASQSLTCYFSENDNIFRTLTQIMFLSNSLLVLPSYVSIKNYRDF